MKVGILGCKGTTLDIIHNIRMRGETVISQVVTLPREIAEKNSVAYFMGDRIKDYCGGAGIPLYETSSYTLQHEADRAFFRSAAIDLLLVLGWERLLPAEILGCLGRFACGMHGSAYGLPKGRGRSPLNWSLITGHQKFITYLFRYSPGMDDGDLIGFKVFDINEFDDIGVLHAKNRIAMGELFHSYAPLIASNETPFFPQPREKPSFYPRRTSADGGIDWARTTQDIHRLVRGVAPPYPGAFTRLRGGEVRLFGGQPFDTGLFPAAILPGTVIDIQISLDRFAVKTGDGTYLATEFEGLRADDLTIGDRFESVSQDAALAEIRMRYPDFVADDEREI